jgi:hypothetical protein
MASVTNELDGTIAAEWRRKLKGLRERDDGQVRAHWRTKVSYYQAMENYLNGPPAALTWQEIVDNVQPRGSRTTFYLVTGTSASHPLLRDYESDQRSYSGGIAALYSRGSAVQKLLDETKVWSYWAYRTGWLMQLGLAGDATRRVAAECLVRVVVDWAMSCPRTAAALDCSPPMAAVEDLVIVWKGKAPVLEAQDLLRDVIINGLGPLGSTTNGVLHMVKDRLYRHLPHGERPTGASTGLLAETAFDVIRTISALPMSARGELLDSAITIMEDAIADLKDLGEGA